MAKASEFVQELDNQIRGLGSHISTLTSSIGERASKLKVLEARRREIIDSTVLVLLPDLKDTTVDALERKLPGFISREMVLAQLSDAEGVYRSRLTDLAAMLGTYDSDLASAQQDLKSARDDLSTLEVAFPALTKDAGLAKLVNNGYGTDRYRRHWYDCLSLDFSFFSDWKQADELVDFYKAKDFNQLSGQYTGQTAAHANVRAAEAKLRDLRLTKGAYEDTVKALNAVPKGVLERIQTKLRAHLDTLSPIPDWMADLSNVDARISSLMVDQRAEQEAHASASSDLTQLSAMRSKVNRSSKREVPDQYIAALRSAGGRSSSSSSSSTVIHVHPSGYSGPGFFSGLLMGEMDSYFAEQRGYERGRRDAGGYSIRPTSHSHVSNPSWQQADMSGQS